MPTYARVDLAFERGEGAWLFTAAGHRYLDFTAGVAVNALGHAHPHLAAALTEQAHKVWHVSNLFRIPEGERLADRLCAISFADTVFFQNSGAEAIECAIKMVRKYQSASGKPERYRIITFEGAFHGRTLAAIAATGNKKYLEGFGPPVDGFDQVPFGDLEAVKRAIGPATAAILIEPIQGEGGVRVAPPTFLRALRQLCDQHGLLLIFDEIQTGFVRSGEMFAYERSGVKPDVMAIAKALGGGFPVGACLATTEASKGMTVGTHGTTFGGNPLAMAVGNAALDIMTDPEFLDTRAKEYVVAQAAPRRAERPVCVGDRGGARRRSSDWPAHDPAGVGNGRRAAHGKNAYGRCRRQRRAPSAAVDHRRGRNIGGRRPNRPRLRAARADACTDGEGGVMTANGVRHFLDLTDIPKPVLAGLIDRSRAMKAARAKGQIASPLAGKTLAMVFDKPSTRTRVSFDVAMRQLGGEAILLTAQEMQLGRGETLADTARVLSRYVDVIMIRILDHEAVHELARHATIPVINGLTRRSHPCQILADVMTYEEKRGPIRGRTVAWTGDANNVLASWMHAAERFDFQLRVATPAELRPKKWLMDWVKSSGAAILIGDDPDAAVKDADCVVTDTWVSMGDRDGKLRHNILKRYQVNARLMAKARPDALFMHCLPAHRGEEVTDEVIDGPQSVVFDEAENRLHAQKGLLAWCLHADA